MPAYVPSRTLNVRFAQVTAAKSIVSGHCGIDMLAGPSECLVLADHTANPEVGLARPKSNFLLVWVPC